MQTLVDLGLLALAAGAILDLWFTGSLFDELRAYFEARDDAVVLMPEEAEELPAESETPPSWMRFLDRTCPDWFCHLLCCRFCLSHHVVFWLGLYWLIATCLLPPSSGNLIRGPLLLLAAVRVLTLTDRVPRE